MKILKIFGIVVGIHVFALILIFANPGCSSSTKPPPSPADTVAQEPAPSITVPSMSPATVAPAEIGVTAVTPAPAGFNPDAPATYGGSGPAVRFTPIRPNTPAATAVQTQPVENVTPATTYTVKSGDSLWSVAKRHHTTVKELAAVNNLRSSATLREGQKLLIPGHTPGAPAPAASTPRSTSPAPASTAAATSTVASRPTSDEFRYTVKPGETLGTIARKFDVRTRDLAVHNNITDPRNLRAGTDLIIPGWQATSGGGTKNGSRPAGTQSATAAQPQDPPQAPNILDPVPSEPASVPTPTSSVPIINIDEPVTPAPKS